MRYSIYTACGMLAPFILSPSPIFAEATDSSIPDLTIYSIDQPRPNIPQSAPIYTIDRAQIDRQGAASTAEVLRSLPGFAVNDVGFGADIHTGTYYRGATPNQFIILLNGRPLGTNINTYHGATDLNSIPVDAIDRIELTSGAGSIIYGSEGFGGVVNIITKSFSGSPQTTLAAEFGSYGRTNYRASHAGGTSRLNYRLGIEQYRTDNNYTVPVGAANRDPATGRLFNADTDLTSYFGQVSAEINSSNRLSFDALKITSRRGLVYFGFPLQRDRLNHDAINVGVNLQSQLNSLGNNTLNTSIAYNQDYFETYGPSGANSRTGTLDSQVLTGRVDGTWQTSSRNKLRLGIELQNRQFNGSAVSTVPNRVALNDVESRSNFNTALFAVNNWQINDRLSVDLGFRQNFNSQFGSYVNPSLGIRWQTLPQVAIRASVAGAQRNPGLDQLYLYDTVHGWLPNANLQPETGVTWNAGADWNISPNSTAKITYFGSSLDNRLGIQAGRWENIGSVATNGLEVGFRQQINPQLSAFVNYTYTDAKIQTGADAGRQLGLIPYSVAQLGLGYANNGWEVNLLGNYNSGTRRAFFTNPGQTSADFVPAFFNIDLSTRIPIRDNIALNFYVENLADVQYEKVNRIYSPGRTIRGGITATF